MITWMLNKWGNIEIWMHRQDLSKDEVPEADFYLETEIDVQAFFKNIGIEPSKVSMMKPGTWGFAEKPDYLSPQEDDDEDI